MANPPSKFFKDFNTTNITPVTNPSTNSANNTNNAAGNINVPTPSTTPPPAYNRGLPPLGTFYDPYARSMGNHPGIQPSHHQASHPQQLITQPAYRIPNALGIINAMQYGTPIPAGLDSFSSQGIPANLAHNTSPHAETYDDDEDASDAKTIKLLISCPISVKGNNNKVMICPVVGASNIITAVVQAIKEASMCQGGVPMIDEDGVPRGLEVKVEAGIAVEGDGNLVGDAESFEDDERPTRSLRRDVAVQAIVEDRVVFKRPRDTEGDVPAAQHPSKKIRQTQP